MFTEALQSRLQVLEDEILRLTTLASQSPEPAIYFHRRPRTHVYRSPAIPPASSRRRNPAPHQPRLSNTGNRPAGKSLDHGQRPSARGPRIARTDQDKFRISTSGLRFITLIRR